MFSIKVNKNNIIVSEAETLTSGSINAYMCEFAFDEAWDGLTKTVTFKAGDKEISLRVNDNDACLIPWEVLTNYGEQLYVGAYGVSANVTTQGEEVVIPTVWALLGTIRRGADIGEEPTTPTENIYTQILIELDRLEADKQDKISGVKGQVVGFDDKGNPIAQDDTKGVTYTAGENISISDDNVISAAMYNDTAIRAEISANSEAIRNVSDKSVALENDINSLSSAVTDNTEAINKANSGISGLTESKQDKITGVKGQIVGFDDNGNPIAQASGGGGVIYTAGDNITISDNNVISAAMYDDTTLKADIAKNTTSINSMKADISANASAIETANTNISQLSSSLQSANANISANTSAIETANANISANASAIETANTNISQLSSSLQSTKSDVSANASAIATANANISGLESRKQDKLSSGDNISISSGNVISATNSTYSIIKDGEPETPGAIAEYHLVDTTGGGPVETGESIAIPDMRYNDANILAEIAALDADKQNKITGTKGQFVGFDENGNPIAQAGGIDGVTFTPTVSEEGIISWSNDGGRENPAPVNIKGQPGDPGNNGVTPHIGDNGHWYIGETDTGVAAQGPTGPAGTYSAGAGIEIANDTICLKNTASTKYNSGTANITGIGGFDFTLTSQTSNIISLTEYLKTSPSGEGSTAFKTRYGYAQIKISARRSATLSTAKALRIVMSDSVNIIGASGFARITLGEGSVTSENIYLALVYADSDYLYVYPTQAISIAQSGTLSIDLYVH